MLTPRRPAVKSSLLGARRLVHQGMGQADPLRLGRPALPAQTGLAGRV